MKESIRIPVETTKMTDLRIRADFEFKLQDLWVGAFWKRRGNCVDLWLCLVPCLPLHICWYWHDPKQ